MAKFKAADVCKVEPLEIELGDRTYQVEKITLPTWNRAREAGQAKDGKSVDFIGFLSEVLPEKREVLEELPAQHVMATFNYIIKEYNKGLPEPEKKDSGHASDDTAESRVPTQDSTQP